MRKELFGLFLFFTSSLVYADLVDIRTAFQQENDLPAAFVDSVTEKEVHDSWEKFFTRVDASSLSASEVARSWRSLQEINEQAARVWRGLRECAGSAEGARHIYFTGNDGNVCKNELLNVAIFRENVRQFLVTSLVDRLSILEKQPLVHPLFSQVLLERAAVTIRFNRDPDYGEEKNSFYDRAIGSYQFSQMMLYLQGKASRASIEMYRIDTYPLDVFNEARATINVLFLLETLPAMDCREWGLWPLAAYAVTSWLKFSLTETSLSSNFGLVSSPSQTIEDRHRFSCTRRWNVERYDSIKGELASLHLQKFFHFMQQGELVIPVYRAIDSRFGKILRNANREKDIAEGKLHCFLGLCW